MSKFEVNITAEKYRDIVSGVSTFLHLPRDKYHVGDILELRERKGELLTGRCCKIEITEIYSGKLCNEATSVISFQLLFPATELRVSISAFMQLFNNFCELRHELEALKESM